MGITSKSPENIHLAVIEISSNVAKEELVEKKTLSMSIMVVCLIRPA